MGKRFLIYLTVFVFLLSFSPSVLAHPGRTAADGCHYCRTNCDKWGVPWDERHCHNGGSAPAVTPPKPVATRKPYAAPTSKPTLRPTYKPVASPTPLRTCSATSDGICPNNCTAGNDSDCCARKSDYKWYDNWGCYPKKLFCSAQSDGVCHWYCSAGNDADCCEQKLESYQWYENWGCYEK